MAKVAFLGTGLLGSAMVERMLRRGEQVTVWNRTESKARALERTGARVARTASEAVDGVDRVHMTFSDDSVVDRVLGDVARSLAVKTTVVDHTTTSPQGTSARVERMRQLGVKFVHAPVFMSPQMARDGAGLIMVSGPLAVFESVRDALQAMTAEVWYVGESGGTAASYKLFGNSMIFVITGGLADVFAMAKAQGIAPADALQVFSKFQPAGTIKFRGEKMARADFSASFELTMARKDVRLMLEAAEGQPLTVLPSLAARMDDTIAKGHGAEDLAAIAAEVVR